MGMLENEQCHLDWWIMLQTNVLVKTGMDWVPFINICNWGWRQAASDSRTLNSICRCVLHGQFSDLPCAKVFRPPAQRSGSSNYLMFSACRIHCNTFIKMSCFGGVIVSLNGSLSLIIRNVVGSYPIMCCATHPLLHVRMLNPVYEQTFRFLTSVCLTNDHSWFFIWALRMASS